MVHPAFSNTTLRQEESTILSIGVEPGAFNEDDNISGYLVFSCNDPSFHMDTVWIYGVNSDGSGNDHPDTEITLTLDLAAPFPNPFNSSVTVPYQLARAAGMVSLEVYDLLGRRVWRPWSPRTGILEKTSPTGGALQTTAVRQPPEHISST